MSTYRIYVDSRDRQSGTAEDFTYALPYTVNITEKSLANIDAVVIPTAYKQSFRELMILFTFAKTVTLTKCGKNKLV